jgi:hypothetical protein
LLLIKVLQKFCTYSKEPKKEWTEPKRESKPTETPTKTPHPLLILTNSFFVKIDPYGMEFAMMILCPHGFGNVVARGHNLRVQLQSQNCEFAASGGEHCLAANKNYHQI